MGERKSALEDVVIKFGVQKIMNKTFLEEAYSGKKVFLTGHTGFKGTWLLQWLRLWGAEVKGYALAPENSNDLYHLIGGDGLCESVIGDLKDSQSLEEAILGFQPDYIFHLAAQPLVRISYQIPVETLAVNAIGTAHVLEAVRKLSKPCVVVLITTDKVYENKEWFYPYRETDVLGGFDPYSASKACAELIINSYAQSFFNPNTYERHRKAIASARAGNVIGGGDWAQDRIIPDIIRGLTNQMAVKVRNPRAIRPWQHVLEPLGGYLILGAKLAEDAQAYGGGWNFGPIAEDNKEVEELVQMAIAIWGSGTYEKSDIQGQPHEAGLLKLDISKALAALNWKPLYSSTRAISKTIEWYKIFSESPGQAKDFTIHQIQEYLDLWN